MTKVELNLIHGKLITAVSGGGVEALWGIARGTGKTAEIAAEILELVTSPFVDISIEQAIEIVMKNQK